MDQMRRARELGDTNNSHEAAYAEFQPSSDWTHDPKSHVLLVDLPGFKKEQLKVQINNLGKLTVSGERQVTENKYQRFKHIFDMPEDSDFKNISARFDGALGLLFIIIPTKKTKQESENENQTGVKKMEEGKKDDEKHVNKETPKKDDLHEQGHGSDLDTKKKEENKHEGPKEDRKRKSEQEENEKSVKEETNKREEGWGKIKKNKLAILTVGLLAFSIGLYISQKFYSTE